MIDVTSFTLADLAAIVADRAGSTAGQSYTKSLLDGGMGRVAKKFGEEAVEAIIAATQQDGAALTCEAADVLYHLLVLLQAGGVPLQEVMAELERRTGRSGLEEKASRHG
jgi:phosphoribosyl-ATP pyrophosphohydrolase